MQGLLPFLTDPAQWPVFVLVSARVTGLMLISPMWSMVTMPRAIRGALTVVLTLAVMQHAPAYELPAELVQLPLPIALEMVIGIAIGLTAAVIMNGVAMAGEVVSLQTGLSLGPALAPMLDTQVSGLGQIKSTLATMLYLSIGGHLFLITGLAESLQIVPPGSAVNLPLGARTAVDVAGTVFSTGVRAAAPIMVTLLLVNVALALIGRAVPQFNTMMVSFPVHIGVGLLMFGACVPVLAGVIGGWVNALPGTIDHVVHSLAPVNTAR